MTVKELYIKCLNFGDNSWVTLFKCNEKVGSMYMRELVKRYENAEVEWFEFCKNNTYNMELKL
jgi:hypothetical protein